MLVCRHPAVFLNSEKQQVNYPDDKQYEKGGDEHLYGKFYELPAEQHRNCDDKKNPDGKKRYHNREMKKSL